MNWKIIGIRVLENRKRMGLTQEQLAEKVDLSVSYISHIERGTRKASMETMVKISNILGITVNELLYGNQSNDNSEYQTDMDMLLEGCTCKEKRLIYLAAGFAKILIMESKD